MLIPSKFTTINESILFKAVSILENKTEQESLANIVNRLRERFDCSADLIRAMDALYVLGALDIDMNTGAVSYAEQNLV